MVFLTRDMLVEICGAPKERITQELVDTLNRTMVRYGINTIRRQSHFLGQIAHESGCFRYTEEIASGEAYEGRLDLGNTEPGDGIRFKGRGCIQITGRDNYAAYSFESGYDFLRDPKELADLPHAALSAGWFWRSKKLNELADTNDVKAVTRRVNGGLNHLENRRNLTQRAETVLTMHRERTLAKVTPLPPEPIPAEPPKENLRPAPRGVPGTSHFVFESKPKWIGFSRVTLGVVVTLFGAFGGKVGFMPDIIANWDSIFIVVGSIVTLVGRIFAKQDVYLWPTLPRRKSDRTHTSEGPR